MEVSIGDRTVLIDESDWTGSREVEFAFCGLVWRGVAAELQWRIKERPHTSYVVCTLASKLELSLHRVVLSARKNQLVDHINGIGTDNRRENLRIADCTGNARNRGKTDGTQSRFKGVGRSGNRWVAWIRIDGWKRHLGSFSTEEEAAYAYNTAASNAFGQFARLNVIASQNPSQPSMPDVA